jgi:hypothetical protein
MTSPDLELLMDITYHRDQRLDDPIALARYAATHGYPIAAAGLYLASIALCDGDEQIRLPSSVAEAIYDAQVRRLDAIASLTRDGFLAGLTANPPGEDPYLNVTELGLAALAAQEQCPCPDHAGAATTPG